MRPPVLALTVALLASLLAGVGQAQSSSGLRLRLHRATFDARAAPAAATGTPLGGPATGGYAIIQLRRPIAQSDRAALEATGVELLEYVPDFAYLVRGEPAQLAAAERLPQVYARAPFTAADKLAPALLALASRGTPFAGRLRVVGWPDDGGALGRALQAQGMPGAAPAGTSLLQLAALPEVRWIEPVGEPRLLNDHGRTIMRVEQVWQQRSLFGAGQIVAVADSGLDSGDPATISPDFSGRIAAAHVLADGGDLEDEHGHGTHVAGSIAGSGAQSGADPESRAYSGSFAGVAPEARLVVQAFEADSAGAITGLPDDYFDLFQQAYDDGARVHSNSWGDPTGPASDPEAEFGGYPYGAQRADAFAWEHKDMAILFAAGNAGRDGAPNQLGFCTGGDGVVDPDSLYAPGTAKNVITVGASESDRTSGGLAGLPWLLISFCFGVNPIATDPTSGNANGMAAFSSRGPTDDGRAKPDLVAPGVNIVSNRSHAPEATALWGAHETNEHYAYSGGTSMATPLVAGAAALVRQWLADQGITSPSAAAVKAALLNTTHNMAPGQYGGGRAQEIPDARPNGVAGWGRADLGFLAAPAGYALWVDDHASGIATGGVTTYTHGAARPLLVTSRSQPLRVMLAWADPPASLSAARQLVNDLDLRVTGPDGTIYYGNGAAAGDRVNNVEGIVIDDPPLGQYTVEVRGFNVPMATQPYALAVGGPLGTAPALDKIVRLPAVRR